MAQASMNFFFLLAIPVLVELSLVNELLGQPAQNLRLSSAPAPTYPPPYLQHDINVVSPYLQHDINFVSPYCSHDINSVSPYCSDDINKVSNNTFLIMAPKRKRLALRSSDPKSPHRPLFRRAGSNVSDSSQKSQSPAKLVLSPAEPGGQLFFGYSRSEAGCETVVMPKATPKFWCDVCSKPFGSRAGLLGHESGKLHLEKLGLKSKHDT